MFVALALALAFVLDAAVGEPLDRRHPVAWFGALADRAYEWSSRLAGEDARRRVVLGTALALALPAGAALAMGAAAVGIGLAVADVAAAALAAFDAAPPDVLAAGWPTRLDPLGPAPFVTTAVAAVALWTTLGRRRLLRSARAVVRMSEDDLAGSKAGLPALVGRNPEPLDPPAVRSAAVESAAENLADGFVAPCCGALAGAGLAWAALAVGGWPGGGGMGSPTVAGVATTGPSVLPVAGAVAGAAWVTAVETLDSMVGYHDEPLGGPAARLDDAIVWVPARLTAGLIAAAALAPRAPLLARPWLAGVPSPNAGWPIGVLAAGVDCRLAKPGVYALNDDAASPDVERALAAVDVVAVAGLLAAFGFVGAALGLELVVAPTVLAAAGWSVVP